MTDEVPEPILTEPPPGRFASRFEGADHGSSVSFFVSIHPRPRMEQEWLGS